MIELQLWMVIVGGILAVLGGVSILIIIWCIFDSSSAPMWSTDMEKYLHEDPGWTKEEFYNDYRRVGYMPNSLEPTLNGRVRMIEEHLGIETIVKPATPEHLVVRKVKKK